jgi:hypothetical protein
MSFQLREGHRVFVFDQLQISFQELTRHPHHESERRIDMIHDLNR